MHFTNFVAVGLCAASSLVSASLQVRDVLEDLENLQNQAIAALQNATDNGVAERSCSIFNAYARKDW
jgi:hypothetical protein